MPPPATVATKGSGYNDESAVCGGHEMTAGVHYARFELRELGRAGACVGVAGSGLDPTTGGLASGGSRWGLKSAAGAQGWVMWSSDGKVCHDGSERDWAGKPKETSEDAGDAVKEGDVVVRRPPCAARCHGCAEGLVCVQGMALDLDAGR